jgi:hypothetical protein
MRLFVCRNPAKTLALRTAFSYIAYIHEKRFYQQHQLQTVFIKTVSRRGLFMNCVWPAGATGV